MDERIVSARDVTKLYPRGGGFDGAEMGVLGTVGTGDVEFFYQPVRKHTQASDFDVSALGGLPRVGISYSYAGAPGVADLEAKAVIVATSGFGADEERYLRGLRRQADVAVLGWDMLDARPNQEGLPFPVHGVLYSYGVPLLDNALLAPLAAACAEERRYEFMFMALPLKVARGTGSPVNPIALF